MARKYETKTQSKRVLVSREVEQYSQALRQASGLARMDGQTAVVWKRDYGSGFVSYHVTVEGVIPEGYFALCKVVPV